MKEKSSLDIHIMNRNLKAIGTEKVGITLIALVITVVILVILASVTINIVLDENGIIGRVKSAQQLQRLAEEKEQMELAKTTVAIDNKGKIPANIYIENLIQENLITRENVKYNEDKSIQMITRMNRTLKIEVDEGGNIIAISEVGPENEPTAHIENIQLTETISSIKLEVKVTKAENATYRYFYKEETGEYQNVYEGKDLNFTIDRLKSGTNYWIKVEVTNDYGTVSKEVLGKTKEIVKGLEGVGDIQKIGEYNDKFGEIEAYTYIDNLGTITVELFVEAVKEEGSVSQENIMINHNGNYQMITNEGYVFEVVLKSKNDVEATYIGIAQR